jgi:TRAP transporter TAXI family solute receptor
MAMPRRTSLVPTSLALAAALALGSPRALAAEPQRLVLAAGKNEPTFALAQLLCQLVNQQQKRHNIACEANESGGPVAALQNLDGEEVHIAFARADWLAQAADGSGPFRDRGPVRGSSRERRGGANEDLRALFSLQVETFIVLARADAGIKAPADLKAKRVNIGPPGSGGRIMFDLLAPAFGWAARDFNVASELKSADQADALCKGRVDAVLYLAANPDAGVRATAQACETVLVPIAGREIEELDKETRFLLRAPVPGGLYKGAPREVPSVGFAIVAASTSKVDARAIYELVKTAFDGLARLQRVDTVFARLEPRRMTGDGLVVPLHDGAAKLYKERGWIK